jgi:putative heme-binding domain-containing protein
LARAEHTAALVTAIEAGRIPVADLSSTEINFLRTHPNPIIAGRAAQIFGRAEPPRREIVDQFARALKPAGSAVRGRQLFQNRCGSCHEIAGANQKLGPDLAKARSGGREKLLVDILDPSREVLLSFATYVLETNSGETLVGVLDDPNGINAVLRQPNGRSIVAPRNQIAALTSRPWSLMPTDAAEGLTVQEVADLIEYVMTGR